MDIKVNLSIGYLGAEREDVITIEDEALDGLTEKEKEEIINNEVEEWAWNYIELNWEPLPDPPK